MRALKIKPLVVALSLACVPTYLYAAADNNAEVAKELKQMNQEMQQLQSQVHSLRSQVTVLKGKLRNQQNQKVTVVKQTHVVKAQSQPKGNHVVTIPKYTAASGVGHTKGWTQKQIIDHKNYVKLSKLAAELQPYYHSFGTSVVTAPYTGTPAHYDGSDFIVNAPSINEGAKLLERRALEMMYYLRFHKKLPSGPRLVLSGDLVGIGQYTRSYRQKYNSDIDLTQADLDAYAEITPWVSGFMALSYDNSAAVEQTRRVSNSRIFMDQGFITIGNLLKSPIYGSLGQMFVPFGRYSSIMITDPLTKFLGKTKARALTIGVDPRSLATPYFSAFLFRGAASTSNETKINDAGFDFGYRYNLHKWNINVGASYVYDIANADGMQDNGRGSGFQGFSQGTGSDNLAHPVGGGDIHATLGYGPFTILGEYVTALRRFSTSDLTYNGHGARPSAYTVEGDYSFNMFGLPSTFGLSFGASHEALGFNIPAQRYLAALQMQVQRYTLVTLEFRHDVNYGRNDTSTHVDSTGAVIPGFTANELGKDSNSVTAQIGIYY